MSANKRAIAEKGRCEYDDVSEQLAQPRRPKMADYLHQLQDWFLQPNQPHLLLLVRLPAGALDRTQARAITVLTRQATTKETGSRLAKIHVESLIRQLVALVREITIDAFLAIKIKV